MWSLWGEKLSSCLSTLSCNHGLDTSLLPFNLATQTPGEDLLNPVLLSFKLKGNYTECDYTLASHFVKYTSTKLDPPLTSWWKHLTCDSCPYWHDGIKKVLHIGLPHIYDANCLFKHIPKVLCWIELCGRHLSTVNSLHSRNQFGMISDVWHSRYTIQVWSQRDRQNSMWHKKKHSLNFRRLFWPCLCV